MRTATQKQKRSLKLNRKHILQLYRGNLCPARAPLRHTPLNPLSRGETYHSIPTLSRRKLHPNLPSREGTGVCDIRAQPPKIKASTQSSKNTTSPNNSKNHLIPNRTSHRNTPLDPLSRGESYHPTNHTPKTTEKNTPATTNPNQKSLYLLPIYPNI